MTISSEDRKAGPFNCNGVTTAFAFEFKVFSAAEVRVVYATEAGVESDLVKDTDYTVSLNADQDDDPGGSITTIGASSPIADGTLTITSQVDETQGTELPSGGGWFPKVIENALDRLTILVQQLALLVRGALRQPISDTDVIGELPTAAERAEKFLYFDVNGDPTAAAAATGDAVVSAPMEPVVSAASLGAALTELGFSAYIQTLINDANAAAARATLDVPQLGLITAAGGTYVGTGAGTVAQLPATATVAAHATTCNPWTAHETVLSGSAVTFTDIADAPYAGAVAWVRMNAAHIWTQGAVFNVQGGATYTTAAGDWVRIRATTVSTFDVTIFPATPAATAAEQETGTDLTKFVTPGRQQRHPSAAKAWASFNGTGTIAIGRSYNVTSLTDNGTGDYSINFTTAFSDTSYVAVAGAKETDGTSDTTMVVLDARQTIANTFAVGSFRLKTAAYSGGASTGVDAVRVSAAFFGDQ